MCLVAVLIRCQFSVNYFLRARGGSTAPNPTRNEVALLQARSASEWILATFWGSLAYRLVEILSITWFLVAIPLPPVRFVRSTKQTGARGSKLKRLDGQGRLRCRASRWWVDSAGDQAQQTMQVKRTGQPKPLVADSSQTACQKLTRTKVTLDHREWTLARVATT